jgi:tetratricopeptide (TPR) repeat protein
MTVLDVSRLDTAAAVALLRGICSRLTEEQARRIADCCAGLPLALRISAGILLNDEALSVERYLSRLADERQRLTLLRDPDDPARDVQATLLQSYTALDEHTQASFRRLGVLAADADLALIAAVLELPEDEADSVVHQLLRRSLVEYDRTHERWGMHDLVRSCALELLSQAGEEHTARLRQAEHVIALIQQADRRYQSGGNGVLEGLAVFDRERAHLEAIRAWLWVQPPTIMIDTLLIAEADATASLGILRDPLQRVRVAQLERAQAAAQRRGDRAAEGRFAGSLGDAYRELGEIRRATSFYEQALAIARELGDQHGEGQALGNLGNACLSQGELRQALDLYQQHLAIAQALGDRLGEGRALGNLGNTYWALGEVPRAVGYLERWVTIARELGDRHREGKALGNLGSAFHVLGEIQRAIDCYQQHLAIAHELGDRQEQGRALGNLGEAHADIGNLAQAIDCYNQALLLLHDVGDRRNEAYILNQSGCARLRQGQLDEALAQSSAALVLTRSTGDRRLEGVSLLTIAEVHAAAGRTAKAEASYSEALAILEAIGCEGEAARARWAYGQFLVAQGVYERGLALMGASIAYEQQIGHSQADEHASILAQLQQGIMTPST